MTTFLESQEMAELAREQSVRGLVARLARDRMEQADEKERMILERAVRDLLERFRAAEEPES